MRILVVEDDKQTLQFIAKGLQQEGFAVDQTSDGEAGLHFALTEPYDAAIVDIMMPKLDGLSLIDKIRQNRVFTPVIVLSAKSSVDDRIQGLQAGGDDYLVKPFAFSELVARLQALIRRSTREEGPTTITIGDLEMDLIKHKVFRNGSLIDLQPKEFSLLEYLMRNTGRVVSKTMLMEHVWDYNFDPRTTVVEARVCRLRDKIDRPFQKDLIHTVRGVGYILEDKD